jgi:hypothetical protein
MVTEPQFAFWVLTIATFCGFFFIAMIDDAEATDQDVFQGPGAVNPYANSQYSSMDYVHAKEDLIVVGHSDEEGDLTVSYKRETTDEWNVTQIATYDWNSLTGPWVIYGTVATSNGSVCIMAGNYDGATYLDTVYLWTHFLGDPWSVWDDELIIDSTVYYYGAVAINDTDQIMFACRRGSGAPYKLYTQIFDFPNYEVFDFASWQGVSWDGAATLANYCRVVVNLTGEFHHVFEGNDNVQYYVAHVDTWVDKHQIATSLYDVRDAGFLNNDMLVCAGLKGNDYPYYWYQTEYEGAFTGHQISTTYNVWNFGAALLMRANLNYTAVVSFDATDDHIFRWNAAWNGSQASWQASEVQTDIYDTSSIRTTGGDNQRWPQDPGGRQWAMPTDGWAFIGWNESGVSDTHELMFNDTEYYGNLTTAPPEITTASLPNAEFGVFYQVTLTKVNGTAPFNWSVLIGPGWLSIGPLNGTIYGTPDATGTQQVRINLDDVIPRDDERQWTLTIDAASEGADSEPDLSSIGLWYNANFCITALMVCVILVFVGSIILKLTYG